MQPILFRPNPNPRVINHAQMTWTWIINCSAYQEHFMGFIKVWQFSHSLTNYAFISSLSVVKRELSLLGIYFFKKYLIIFCNLLLSLYIFSQSTQLVYWEAFKTGSCIFLMCIHHSLSLSLFLAKQNVSRSFGTLPAPILKSAVSPRNLVTLSWLRNQMRVLGAKYVIVSRITDLRLFREISQEIPTHMCTHRIQIILLPFCIWNSLKWEAWILLYMVSLLDFLILGCSVSALPTH